MLIGTDTVSAEKTGCSGKASLGVALRASWAGGQHCSAFCFGFGLLGVLLAVNAAAVPNVFLCTQLSVSWYLRMTGFFVFLLRIEKLWMSLSVTQTGLKVGAILKIPIDCSASGSRGGTRP